MILRFVITAFLLLFSGGALAKISGDYISLNFNYSKIGTRLSKEGAVTQNNRYSSQEFKSEDFALGGAVGSFFNYKNFLLLAEVFYDDINNQISDNFGVAKDNDVSINYRYGGRLGFGYNFYEDYALYLSYGLALVDSRVSWASSNQAVNQRNIEDILGVGFVYSLNEAFDLNLQYDLQKYEVRTPKSNIFDHIRVRSHILKFGVSYKF
jgi:hypothetical protein